MPEWTDTAEPRNRKGSWAFQLALCLLGPTLFLSYILTIFAALPGLYLHAGTPDRKRGQLWSGLALLIGGALALRIKGWPGGLGFVVYASLPAIVLGELLLRRHGPGKAVMGAVLAMFLAVGLHSWIEADRQNQALLPLVRQVAEAQAVTLAGSAQSKDPNEFSLRLTELLQKMDQAPKLVLLERVSLFLVALLVFSNLPDPANAELLLKDPSQLLTDLPGMFLVVLLLLAALPCLALIRWNPKGFLRRASVPRDYIRKWKSPEWLVWPTLICGAFLLFEVEYLSVIARNALKPLLVIYFFQGMSILAFFLDSLRLRGPLRAVFYGVSILLATPMVVSFGFFDLWFNFRGRVQPQNEDE